MRDLFGDKTNKFSLRWKAWEILGPSPKLCIGGEGNMYFPQQT